MRTPHGGLAWRSFLVSLAALGAFLALAFQLLPKGFSDDLSKIGRGAPVAVLVHDKNSVQSQHLMTLLDRVRADYAQRVDFLVADLDTQAGREFATRQQAGRGALLLFAPDGAPLRALAPNVDEAALRRALDESFAR